MMDNMQQSMDADAEARAIVGALIQAWPGGYAAVRMFLEDLTKAWPGEYHDEIAERARTHLLYHCEDCGVLLEVDDRDLFRDLEMLRTGDIDPQNIDYPEYNCCTACYLKRLQPEAHVWLTEREGPELFT